jgi:hypothetical protein
LGSLVAVAPSSVRADLPTAAIRYTAPPECPGPARFMSLLETRLAGRWRIRQADGNPDFVVEIRDGTSGKIGRVRRGDRPGEGPREIASADCDDLVQALALSTVLSLDRSADAAGPDPVVVKQAAEASPVGARSSWMVGGGASNLFLLPSQAMLAASLFVESGRPSWPPGFGLRRPDIRLALGYARNGLVGEERAQFILVDASLSICPLGAGLSAAVSMRICGSGEAGMLSGEGISVSSPRTSRFLWAAAGAVARLRWAASRRLVVEAHAGAVAPLERTTFIFEMPRVEVAKVPAFVASAGLTVGVTIP